MILIDNRSGEDLPVDEYQALAAFVIEQNVSPAGNTPLSFAGNTPLSFADLTPPLSFAGLTGESITSAELMDSPIKSASDRGIKPASDRGIKPASDRGIKSANDRGIKSASDRGIKPASDRGASELSISLVDKVEMHALNREYRGIDAPTDVLAFENDDELLGDVVICPAKAREHANEFDSDFASEMELMLTHGILHLFGYDHVDEDEAQRMETRENEILELWRAR